MSVAYWNAYATPSCANEVKTASWNGVAVGIFTGVIVTLVAVLFVIYTPIRNRDNSPGGGSGGGRRVITVSLGTGRVISIEELKKLPPQGPVQMAPTGT
jgi:hypothetical protein